MAELKDKKPGAMRKMHAVYLDNLRASGVTNMLGARPFLMSAFEDLSNEDAIKILCFWMQDNEGRKTREAAKKKAKEGAK